MDKSERYLKEIAKNTGDIAKELKRTNREPEQAKVNVKVRNESDAETIRSYITEQDALDDNIKF